MRALVALLALILLLLPAVYGAAQPDNLTQGLSPEDIEWKRRIDEKINMTKLKELEEMEVTRPSLTPEPNVYVSGRGYVTDEQGRFISPLGYYKRVMGDYYHDMYGNSFYVYLNDILIFDNVADSQFKGTYFLVFDENNTCLNCATGVQTFPDYKHYNNWIKPYVEKNYPNYFKIHVKYFLQAKLKDYAYKDGNTVYLIIRTIRKYLTKFEAELWSEENYCKGINLNLKCYHAGWGNNRFGYPDDPDGGASRIRGKAIRVSVGFSHYTRYPGLASRSFGRPYIITLYSRFHHQFALQCVLQKG